MDNDSLIVEIDIATHEKLMKRGKLNIGENVVYLIILVLYDVLIVGDTITWPIIVQGK